MPKTKVRPLGAYERPAGNKVRLTVEVDSVDAEWGDTGPSVTLPNGQTFKFVESRADAYKVISADVVETEQLPTAPGTVVRSLTGNDHEYTRGHDGRWRGPTQTVVDFVVECWWKTDRVELV